MNSISSKQLKGNYVMLTRIHIDPDICEGKPIIRNIRITVDFVLKLIGDGYTVDEIIKMYPELEKEDIQQALSFAAINLDTQVIPLEAA